MALHIPHWLSLVLKIGGGCVLAALALFGAFVLWQFRNWKLMGY